jgi:hypothetical protein
MEGAVVPGRVVARLLGVNEPWTDSAPPTEAFQQFEFKDGFIIINVVFFASVL